MPTRYYKKFLYHLVIVLGILFPFLIFKLYLVFKTNTNT